MLIIRLVLFHGGQRVKSPPGVVFVRELEETVPGGVARALALVRALARIAPVAVEIQAVRAGMAEHAVQNDMDAERFSLFNQGLKLPQIAGNRIDLVVIARIVAVVGARAARWG